MSGFTGALSGLRQFLAPESLLKLMKNAFHFNSKALFVLKIFTFLSWLFVHVAKRLDYKDKVNFKIYDITPWLTDNCNTHIPQYLEVKTMKFGQSIEYNITLEAYKTFNMRNIWKNHTQNVEKLVPDLFLKK